MDLVKSGSLTILNFSDIRNMNEKANISKVTFQANVGGFTIDSASASPVVVNYPYYRNMKTLGKLYSSFDSMNTVIFPSSRDNKVVVEFGDYIFWIYSTAIQLISVFIYILALIWKKQHFKTILYCM